MKTKNDMSINIPPDLINKIKNVDCLELLKELPDKSIDLVVSSPPYNIGKAYETRACLKSYLELQKTVLVECFRVLKDSGSLFWQIGSYTVDGTLIPLDIKFFPILEDLGMLPRNRIIWIRQHGLHATRKFSGRHETILWFTKTNNYKFNLDNIRVPQKWQNKTSYRGDNTGELTCNPDGKNPSDIWLFRNVKHNHEEQTIHPAQFPEDLITRIVLAATDENDIVLDPYMGAGKVAVVAKEFNRFYIGAELEKKYIDVAERRIEIKPDKNGSFPNLKTLRKYIDMTGEDISKYRFDVQVGIKATTSDKSKIYSEEHHFSELLTRLEFEENTAVARVRNEPLPDDSEMVKKPKVKVKNFDLFK
jgi:adenine-specific DNA-methyltransferase